MKKLLLLASLPVCHALYGQNVGLGTTSPKNDLHVHNSGTDASISITNSIVTDNTLRGGRIRLLNSDLIISNHEANGRIHFYTAFNPRFSIDSAGNVGIGQPTPTFPVSILKNTAAYTGGYTNPVMHIKNSGDGGGIYSAYDNTGMVSSEFPSAAVIGHGVNRFGIIGYTEGTGTAIYAYSQSGTAMHAIANQQAILAESISKEAITASTNATGFAAGKFSHNAGGAALELDNGALKVSGALKTAFQIKAVTGVGGNTVGTLLTIPNTTLANAATDLLFVTHFFATTGGLYANYPVGVWWTGTRWVIFSQDTSTNIANGTMFNVLVIKQ